MGGGKTSLEHLLERINTIMSVSKPVTKKKKSNNMYRINLNKIYMYSVEKKKCVILIRAQKTS